MKSRQETQLLVLPFVNFCKFVLLVTVWKSWKCNETFFKYEPCFTWSKACETFQICWPFFRRQKFFRRTWRTSSRSRRRRSARNQSGRWIGTWPCNIFRESLLKWVNTGLFYFFPSSQYTCQQINDLLKWAISGLFYLIFVFSIQLTDQKTPEKSITVIYNKSKVHDTHRYTPYLKAKNTVDGHKSNGGNVIFIGLTSLSYPALPGMIQNRY